MVTKWFDDHENKTEKTYGTSDLDPAEHFRETLVCHVKESIFHHHQQNIR